MSDGQVELGYQERGSTLMNRELTAFSVALTVQSVVEGKNLMRKLESDQMQMSPRN